MTLPNGTSTSSSTSQSSLSTSIFPPVSSSSATSSSSYSGHSGPYLPERRTALDPGGNSDDEDSEGSDDGTGGMVLTWVKPPPIIQTWTHIPPPPTKTLHSAPPKLDTQSGRISLSFPTRHNQIQPDSLPRRSSRPPKPSEKIRALNEPPPHFNTRAKKKHSPENPTTKPPSSIPTPIPSMSLMTTSSRLKMKRNIPDTQDSPQMRSGRKTRTVRAGGRSSSLGEKVLVKVVEEEGPESMPVEGKYAGRKRPCEESQYENGSSGDDGDAEDTGSLASPCLQRLDQLNNPHILLRELTADSASYQDPQMLPEDLDEEEGVKQDILFDDWAFDREDTDEVIDDLSDGVLDLHLIPDDQERDANGLILEEVEEAQEDEEEEEDGDLLVKLLARAERMREGISDIAPEGELLEEEDEGLLLDDMDVWDADQAVEEDRRERALAYLESIIIKFLSQLQTSTSILNEYEKRRLQSKSVKKGKGEKRDKGESEDEGDMLLLEEPEEKVGRGAIGGAGWDHIGIELGLVNRTTGAEQVVSFPDGPSTMGNRTGSQQRLAEIIRVAVLMYEAILTGTVTTKRDIFYKDVNLFKTQSTVDKLVDDIAASAGLKRQDFMVCATSKGLVASSALKVVLRSGEELGFSATNASLIPPLERIEYIDSEVGLDWVLIVEKDAVFQTLCSTGLIAREELGSGVIITGKGYPDLATLQLSALIAVTFPSARFYALVDADPHGLDILSVYANGSKATKYSYDHGDLALGERLKWMGVKATEWATLGVEFDDLLPLSDKDVQKAMAMLLNRPEMPDSWRRELVHMLHLNRKAEIQVLATRRQSTALGADDGELKEANGIVGYVVERLLRGKE